MNKSDAGGAFAWVDVRCGREAQIWLALPLVRSHCKSLSDISQ